MQDLEQDYTETRFVHKPPKEKLLFICKRSVKLPFKRRKRSKATSRVLVPKMPLDVRLFHSGVGNMKNMFDKKVEQHKQAQLENPFSEWEGAGRVRRLSKEDIGYGRWDVCGWWLSSCLRVCDEMNLP